MAYEYVPDPSHVRSALLPSGRVHHDTTATRSALMAHLNPGAGQVPFLLGATAVGYALAYAIKGVQSGDWSLSTDLLREGFPCAAVYVAGVYIGRQYQAGQQEPELEVDLGSYSLGAYSLENPHSTDLDGGKYTEFRVLLREFLDQGATPQEKLRIAKGLCRMMDTFGVQALMQNTELTPETAYRVRRYVSELS